jgi:hypothetical protein
MSNTPFQKNKDGGCDLTVFIYPNWTKESKFICIYLALFDLDTMEEMFIFLLEASLKVPTLAILTNR